MHESMIIMLAEAIGGPAWEAYINPGLNPERIDLPDPFEDANACQTLIYHLNSLGWQVEIHWQFTNDEQLAAGAFIHIWNRDSEIHHRYDIDVDRWKEAVCTLAHEILT